MELFHEYRAILAPELVRLLASLQESQVSPDDLPAILKKDAIYNAVGLAAFDLYDDVCVMNYLFYITLADLTDVVQLNCQTQELLSNARSLNSR